MKKNPFLQHLKTQWESNPNKTVSLDFTIHGSACREQEAQQQNASDAGKGNTEEDATSGAEFDHAAGGTQDPEHIVRQRWRYVGAIQAWPSSGYGLPQLVDMGWDGGTALKKAVAFINRDKPDFIWNHTVDSTAIAGHIESAVWENSSDIPPGITGDVVVDARYDPKAAIGLKEGIIRSGSVGINGDYEPSHPDMDFYEFLEKQGKVVKGEKVRWKLVKVSGIRHLAIVPGHGGADPNSGPREMDHSGYRQNFQENRGGSNQMLEKLVVMYAAVCALLDIDVALVAGGEVPDGLQGKVEKKMTALAGIQTQYNALVSKIQDIGASLIKEGESTLNVQGFLERIPGVIELAKQGETIIAFQRAEAVKWFDTAKVDPEKKREFTDAEKRMRTRLEQSTDLEFLGDVIGEYRSQAEDRYGESRRSSEGADIPIPKTPADLAVADIEESASKTFGSK